MDARRSFDAIWMVQLVAAVRRLLAMAMWQEIDVSDEIEAFVNALDRVVIDCRPQPPHALPVTKIARRALRYGVGAYGTGVADLIRPHLSHLHWQQNGNYQNDPALAAFLPNYGYSELIGPDGISPSDSVRVGLLLMAKGTTYPFHAHPAAEIYYVLSGQGYFKKDARPWRSSPANQFILHAPYQPHAIETRQEHLLALYVWHGDVGTAAQLT